MSAFPRQLQETKAYLESHTNQTCMSFLLSVTWDIGWLAEKSALAIIAACGSHRPTLAQPLLPLHSHGTFLKLTLWRQSWGKAGPASQPHQPNCSSFPVHKWYKVWNCTSQCPNLSHLSAWIDTNGFYKCKSLSFSKLHAFEENMKAGKLSLVLQHPGESSQNALKAGAGASIPKPGAFAPRPPERMGCYY